MKLSRSSLAPALLDAAYRPISTLRALLDTTKHTHTSEGTPILWRLEANSLLRSSLSRLSSSRRARFAAISSFLCCILSSRFLSLSFYMCVNIMMESERCCCCCKQLALARLTKQDSLSCKQGTTDSNFDKSLAIATSASLTLACTQSSPLSTLPLAYSPATSSSQLTIFVVLRR